MRDANENILKMIVNNVQESVDFLEKFINSSTLESLFKPTSACFTSSTNPDTPGMFDFDWNKSDLVSIDDAKNMVPKIYSLNHIIIITKIKPNYQLLRSSMI